LWPQWGQAGTEWVCIVLLYQGFAVARAVQAASAPRSNVGEGLERKGGDSVGRALGTAEDVASAELQGNRKRAGSSKTRSLFFSFSCGMISGIRKEVEAAGW